MSKAKWRPTSYPDGVVLCPGLVAPPSTHLPMKSVGASASRLAVATELQLQTFWIADVAQPKGPCHHSRIRRGKARNTAGICIDDASERWRRLEARLSWSLMTEAARSGTLTGNRLPEGGRRSNIPLLSCLVHTTRQRQGSSVLCSRTIYNFQKSTHCLNVNRIHVGRASWRESWVALASALRFA